MKIPKYWSRATAETTLPRGGTASFSCWRSSDTSEAVAHQAALAAARRILDASLRGKRLDRYDYGAVPMREEVLRQIEGPDARLLAVLTRNGYGSVILNTERVDVRRYRLSGNGRRNGQIAAERSFRPEAKVARGRKGRTGTPGRRLLHRGQSGLGHRLYRTFAGLRAIVTHNVMDPKSTAALDVLKQLGSDPLYIKLCKVQECFRAG